jgi:DNA-binding MarR family transcriptional regulator
LSTRPRAHHAGGARLIGALLRIPAQAVQRHTWGKLSADFPELREAHMPVFQHIEHPPGGSRLTDLADLAQITKQSMGELVDHLERHGYVERVSDPDDRRAKLIRLTARGWAVHETADRVVSALQAEWTRQFGEDRMQQLTRLLRELSDELELDR